MMTKEQATAIRMLAEAIAMLEETKVIRTRQNITGDIGEFIVDNLSIGVRNSTNTKGADFTAEDGAQIEVKTIGTDTKGVPNNTSFIRDHKDGSITYESMLLVWLGRDFQVRKVVRLNNKVINDCKSWNSRTKSFSVIGKKALAHPETVEIKTY